MLALGLPACSAVSAQRSGSNPPNPPAPEQSSSLSQAQQTAGETQGQLSVQARIRQRRAQRRAAAIQDAYGHRFDAYVNMGYQRFKPGPSDGMQRTTYYAWNVGLTRYYNERLGVDLDARGYYGTTFVGLPYIPITKPAISQYDVMGGPTYRFYLQPKYAFSGRVMAGWARGNFSGDTSGITPTYFGLYPDSNTYAASVSVSGDYNIAPNFALRLTPEYFFTGFGSSVQASRGFTIGFVARFGKQ